MEFISQKKSLKSPQTIKNEAIKINMLERPRL